MSYVSATHRILTAANSLEDYHKLASHLKDELLCKLKDQVFSLIYCGSYIKGTIIPGWSDLDVLLIIKNDTDQIDNHIILSIQDIIIQSLETYHIGIGLDLFTQQQLPQPPFYKFLGRPASMTFEVAKYGKIIHGHDILKPINEVTPNRLYIILEEFYQIQSIWHNFRRTVCTNRFTDSRKNYTLHR
jgi:hypothetical protein